MNNEKQLTNFKQQLITAANEWVEAARRDHDCLHPEVVKAAEDALLTLLGQVVDKETNDICVNCHHPYLHHSRIQCNFGDI